MSLRSAEVKPSFHRFVRPFGRRTLFFFVFVHQPSTLGQGTSYLALVVARERGRSASRKRSESEVKAWWKRGGSVVKAKWKRSEDAVEALFKVQ